MSKRQKGKSVRFEIGEGFDLNVGTPSAATYGETSRVKETEDSVLYVQETGFGQQPG